MCHQVQVILILCLSTSHTVSVENINPTFEIFDNHSQPVIALMDNETLEQANDLFDVVTNCRPSAPYLVTEPPASIIGHEGSLVTVTIVFCDIICNVDNVSNSDIRYEDGNTTCPHQYDGVLMEDTFCEEDIVFDDINDNSTDTINTTVKWSLSGITLYPGTW